MTAIPDPFATLRAAVKRQAAQTAKLREAVEQATGPAREVQARMVEALAPVGAHVEAITRPLREAMESVNVTIGVPAAGAVASAGKAVLRAARAELERVRRSGPALRRAARAALAALGVIARPVVVAVVAPPRERARPPGEQVPARRLALSLVDASHAPPLRVLPYDVAARAA